MKLNDIKNCIKETIPEFIDCSKDVMKNMTTEIKATIKFIISTPKLLLNFIFNRILKPREVHRLDFKEQPLRSVFLYIYSILSKPFVFLNGKSIKESADLIDYKYTRWCIATYVTLASTYWTIEIGIPHWDGPKTDFQQLMSHDALIKLTMVFGASIGLIALLHRSIVSDYQIKQQGKSDNISNYYKISEFIESHIDKSFSDAPSNNVRRISSNSLMRSLFIDAKNGNYEISINLTNELTRSINPHITPWPESFKQRHTYNVLENIVQSHEYATLIHTILDPIVSRKIHSSNNPSSYDIDKILKSSLNIGSIFGQNYPIPSNTNNPLDTNDQIEALNNAIIRHISIVSSGKGLISSIPIDDSFIKKFITESDKLLNQLVYISQFLPEFKKDLESTFIFKNTGDFIPSGNNNTQFKLSILSFTSNLEAKFPYFISYIFSCMKLSKKILIAPSVAENLKIACDCYEIINPIHRDAINHYIRKSSRNEKHHII